MVKKYILFLCTSLSMLCNGQQQNMDSLKSESGAVEYVELYDNYIKTRIGFSNSFNSFRITNTADKVDFTLTPNQRLRSTFTVMYRFIEIDLGYTPEFIRFNKDDDSNGKTTYFNLGTRFYFRHWMQNIQFAKTKGFYVDKADLGIPENLLFPNFQVRKIGGSTSYIFNPNFSFRSIFLQSEWQKKSAGSFVPGISYYLTQIKNGGASKDNIFDIALGPAYYYNWVIGERILLSGGAYAGIGYNNTHSVYNDGTPDTTIDGLSWQTQLRFTLGYNTTRFYTGLTASIDTFNYSSEARTEVQDQQQFFEFYIGYRFKAPDKLNKFMDNPPILNKNL